MEYFSRICLFSLLTLSACTPGEESRDKEIQDRTDNLRLYFAPDSRTDRLELKLEESPEGNYISGYTTLPEAYDSLNKLLQQQYPAIENRVRLLPDTAVGAQSAGIIKVSVANLRSKPGHSQELATQALMGTPIEILDKQNDWCLVRTPDRYIAWLEPGAFTALSPNEAKDWLGASLRRYRPFAGVLTEQPETGLVVSDLVAGDLLRWTGEVDNAFSKVALPDGATGWVLSEDLATFADWQEPEGLDTDQLLETATSLAGRPYLWGGTSPKGMDCSGFTKTAYYLNGYVIPRDASQQVKAGANVPLGEDFSQLQPGDLLFFGSYRDDGSEKVTHVGFYLGTGYFLHAGADNGRIMENSLFPEDPLFAPHRLKSLLRAQRLLPGQTGVRSVREAFSDLVE